MEGHVWRAAELATDDQLRLVDAHYSFSFIGYVVYNVLLSSNRILCIWNILDVFDRSWFRLCVQTLKHVE